MDNEENEQEEISLKKVSVFDLMNELVQNAIAIYVLGKEKPEQHSYSIGVLKSRQMEIRQSIYDACNPSYR